MFDKINLMGGPKIHHNENQINNDRPINEKFKTLFKDALNKVSETEHEANYQQKMLVQGKTNDLHNVMLAAQKATITVEAAVQVQQKVIDTYNEVMRMQI